MLGLKAILYSSSLLGGGVGSYLFLSYKYPKYIEPVKFSCHILGEDEEILTDSEEECKQERKKKLDEDISKIVRSWF